MSVASRATAILTATAALLTASPGPVATAPVRVDPVTTNEPQPPRDVRPRQYVPTTVGPRPVREVPPASLAGHTAIDAIGWCESRNRYDAKNPTSSASGRHQWIDSTWEWVTGLPAPARAHPPHVQDAAFRKLWDDGRGWRHWLPSRSCWAPLLEGHAGA